MFSWERELVIILSFHLPCAFLAKEAIFGAKVFICFAPSFAPGPNNVFILAFRHYLLLVILWHVFQGEKIAVQRRFCLFIFKLPSFFLVLSLPLYFYNIFDNNQVKLKCCFRKPSNFFQFKQFPCCVFCCFFFSFNSCKTKIHH